ncbi:hypothetical protein N9072_00375 [bacterium]|nr:hypothetical protein [Akkermansiaceae bacterium]MDB4505329.1 hypothetical protein [bacterium]MDB4304546.1 hypothetical protein [Akkermansiaceae bacterium]MDB4508872.1 hypothetical protein [Akkermansiaceae bacterium]MDB4546242.1 hypothetical protein [Akkermansiaceae bacterium]
MTLLRHLTGLFLIFGSNGQAETLYQDSFDVDGLALNSAGVGGGAINKTISGHSWVDDGDASFVTSGTQSERRALLYSEQTFQSDTGFRLTVKSTTGSIEGLAGHQFSFGLVSSNTDLSAYLGFNPFAETTSISSVGVSLTTAARGLNLTDGSSVTSLDHSGTNAQFKMGQSSEVTIEIGVGGYWCYRIDGVYEASGILLEEIDLSKDYHVVVYGQGDDAKSIQSIKLETAPAAGERAAGLRGNWQGGQGDLERLKDFKTLDSIAVRFSDGATESAQHYAPHKLLETIALEGIDGTGPAIDFVVAPTWGDLSLDEPEDDSFFERILEIKAAGFKIKAYLNSENFVGSNKVAFQEFVDRWKEYCDTDPEVQAFISSQPFHTGIWNQAAQQYEDASATYPNRKYMFCYAEYVLKDYALRYGDYFGSWVFDDGATMAQNGDSQTSGLIEEQRIYQAYANAVHAGNPDLPIAFNNGRSTVNYASFPYAHAVRFDDFTFGHAFGGNDDHASKTGTQFANNYKHIARMTATNGYVHDGGNWDWDDLIVGNFHSKLSTKSWKFGTIQAWEEADFFQWNLEALQAGGHITWNGSITRTDPTLQTWAHDLLTALDDHLSQHESPGAPNWTRAHTVLPDAVMGLPYHHVLEVEKDFWDPEGDVISAITATGDAASWLSIDEDPNMLGRWVMSGTPSGSDAEMTFNLRATDVNGQSGDREVELTLDKNPLVSGVFSRLTVEFADGSPLFKYTRLVDSAEGIEQIFQYSTDLIHWNELQITGEQAPEVSIGEVVDGREELTISIDEELAVGGQLYGRLKIILE